MPQFIIIRDCDSLMHSSQPPVSVTTGFWSDSLRESRASIRIRCLKEGECNLKPPQVSFTLSTVYFQPICPYSILIDDSIMLAAPHPVSGIHSQTQTQLSIRVSGCSQYLTTMIMSITDLVFLHAEQISAYHSFLNCRKRCQHQIQHRLRR